MTVIQWLKQGGRRYTQWGSPVGIGLAWPSAGAGAASTILGQLTRVDVPSYVGLLT